MANSKMTVCKHCGAEIAKNAKVCPQCGGKNKKPIFLRPWFIVLVVLVVLAIIIGSSGSKSSGTTQVGTVSTSGTSSSGKTTQSSSKTAEPTPEPKTIYNVGDILQDGNVQIVYSACGEYVSDNEYIQPKSGNKYIFLEFAFLNTGKSDASVSFYSFNAFADGYSADMFYGADDDLSATLSAGRSTVGRVYFEVPADAKEIEVEYTPNMFLDKKIKFIYEGNKESGYVLEPVTSRTEGALSVGDVYETSTLRISYLACNTFANDNMFIQPKSGYHYVYLEFEFENLGNSDKQATSFSFDCYADGVACASLYIRDDDLQATISAGRKAKGTVSFEVPDNAEVIEAEFNNNIWTSDRIAFTVK